MSAGLRLSLVERPEALWPRAAEWNALLESSATNTVFQTLEWLCSWWVAFGSGAEPLILVAEAGNELVGVAPLMVAAGRIFGRDRRVLQFIGGDASDYCDFIVPRARSREIASRMLGWLSDQGARWDVMRLLNIADSSSLIELLPRFGPARGYSVDLQRLYECPTRVLSNPDEDRRLARKRDSRQKQLARQGRLSFRRYQGRDEMDAALEVLFGQHIARWEATPTPSRFRDPRERAFYRALVQRLEPGWVLFSALLFDEAPIAFHFGYEYRGRFYVILHSFDPAYRPYAPGVLHIRYLLEHALARNAAELDFTVGDEGYKYRFSNRARVNYVARANRRWMFYGADRVLAQARSVARRFPALAHVARRVKPLLGGTP